MSATGLILDAVLMLLLVAALGFGLRLEKKLSALRAGQVAFAGAVTELNAAAGRAEAALASLRAAGQETDMLHDRIVKARAVKQELEALIARGPGRREVVEEAVTAPAPAPVATAPTDGDAAARIAALKARLEGSAPAARTAAPERREVEPVQSLAEAIRLLTARQAVNPSASPAPNRARRNLDEDLFAA